MQRDQRISYNWGLLLAQWISVSEHADLLVVFHRVTSFLDAQRSHFQFMDGGLAEVAASLEKLQIPLRFTKGDPVASLTQICLQFPCSTFIWDFNPLRLVRSWQIRLMANISARIIEVDSHNIIPAWETSPKQEFAAYTIRKKIQKKIGLYLDSFPGIQKQILRFGYPRIARFTDVLGSQQGLPESYPKPGYKEALQRLRDFAANQRDRYAQERNDPNANATSRLSPYLHFGQISSLEVVLYLQGLHDHSLWDDSFFDELIVRKELAENFCYYNCDYDSLQGAPAWAFQSLEQHRQDAREYVYPLAQWEEEKTHDAIWNAAQRRMRQTGYLHGYMRMYWAKKILEWSSSPEDAIRTAVYLNDRYQLDGRDVNGYAGILWSIAGLHDRPWPERKIYGKVRYMNAAGCKRKFDTKKYINESE